ncbi:MAG: hypothetical protein OHK0012_20190 [Synechococcales cyanobacterium]
MITHIGVETIQDEVRRLLCAGVVRPSACISQLQCFFPAREWTAIEQELLMEDYQMQDCVADLLGHQEWDDD